MTICPRNRRRKLLCTAAVAGAVLLLPARPAIARETLSRHTTADPAQMAVVRQNWVWIVGPGYARKVPDFPITDPFPYQADLHDIQSQHVTVATQRGDLRWELPQGKQVLLTQGHGFGGTVPLWLDNHRFLAGRDTIEGGADGDGGVWLVDTARKTQRLVIPAEDADFCVSNSFTFSPDRKWIAIQGGDATGMEIRIIADGTWKAKRRWQAESVRRTGKRRKPGQYQFFPGGSGFAWQDSQHLLVACDPDSSGGSRLERVDVDTGHHHILLHPKRGEVSDVRFDPRRREMIVAADHTIKLISTVTRHEPSVPIPGHFDLGDLSPDGRYLSVLVHQGETNLSTLYWLDLNTLHLTRICPDVQAASWEAEG